MPDRAEEEAREIADHWWDVLTIEDREKLAADIATALRSRDTALAEARAEIERLEKLVYVPGHWCCAKCSFYLVQSNLNAFDGSISARDKPGEKCPNCDVPLWRVTERQAGDQVAERCGDAIKEAVEARERIRALEGALRSLRGLVKEGGVPRYTVIPGAALNSVIEEVVDPVLRARTILSPATDTEGEK